MGAPNNLVSDTLDPAELATPYLGIGSPIMNVVGVAYDDPPTPTRSYYSDRPR